MASILATPEQKQADLVYEFNEDVRQHDWATMIPYVNLNVVFAYVRLSHVSQSGVRLMITTTSSKTPSPNYTSGNASAPSFKYEMDMV
jgi:hypothetical protein